jgi:outer membrane protein assembly factor BamB
MSLSDLIFTGFNRRVAALNKRTGEIVWQQKLHKGNQYVTLLLDDEVLIAAVDGYMYGLAALTGEQLWFNEMSGFGTGVTSLTSMNGSAQNLAAAAAANAAAAASHSTTAPGHPGHA